MSSSVKGKFVKEMLPGMKKHGQYRGAGMLEVTSDGIWVEGKHVYTLRQRWLFACGIFVGMVVLTGGSLAPGIIIMYLVVEYIWLKDGNQLISFERVERYNAIPKKKLVGIQFQGTEFEAPIVMQSAEWRTIYDELVRYIPHPRVG